VGQLDGRLQRALLVHAVVVPLVALSQALRGARVCVCVRVCACVCVCVCVLLRRSAKC
jgi:hypothetical protein